MIKLTDIEILNRILEDSLITPVYQPIVSLSNGKIFGYEALSRVLEDKDSDKIVKLDIEYLFKVAHRMNKSWELEALCRKKTLEHAKDIVNTERKLFINVNPNIIHDMDFKEGFTKKRLDEYGLNANNVVFEITEYAAIMDKCTFLESISHYRRQSYLIAIDDVGSGYSALDLINNIKPDIIKLDLNLIRNIDKDTTKQFLCKAMIDFGNNAGIKVIAEGIETEEELRTLIKLNVGFGQGYYMSTPNKDFVEIEEEKVEKIKMYHSRKLIETFSDHFNLTVGYLANKGYCVSSDKNAGSVYEMLKFNPAITEITVIENNVAVGFMTKADLNDLFSSRYGFNFYSKKSISEIMSSDFLAVDYRMSVDQVSKLAMQRPFDLLYNSIVVEQDGKYEGIVTVKDLLEACTR